MRTVFSICMLLLISAGLTAPAMAQQTDNPQKYSGFVNNPDQQNQSGYQYTQEQKTVFAIPYLKELFDKILTLKDRMNTASGDAFDRVKKEHDKYEKEYIKQLERQEPLYTGDAAMHAAILSELERVKASRK